MNLLNNNKITDKKIIAQSKILMLEMVKKEKIETAKQLVNLMQERHNLAVEQTSQMLLELENEGKICFVESLIKPLTSVSDYLFSARVTWFWIVIGLVLSTVVVVFFIPENAYPFVYLRFILGGFFVLYLPGYTFLTVLFPLRGPQGASSDDLNKFERGTLSLALSLTLTFIIGLINNYSPWGVRLVPVMLSLVALTVILATIAVLWEYQTYQPENNSNKPINNNVVNNKKSRFF